MRKILTIILVLLSVQAFAQRKVQWRDLGATVKDRINSKGVFLSTYGDLSSAVDAATAGYLIIDDSVLTTVNKDLSSIHVWFTAAGMLNVQSGDTITFGPGSIIADPDQKIFHDGGGEVRMPGAHIYGNWFGMVADGSTNNATTFQWAVHALRGDGNSEQVIPVGGWGTLELGAGKYVVNPTTNISIRPDSAKTIWLKGQGDQTKITQRSGTYGDLLVDYTEAQNARPQGTLRFTDFVIDSTTQGLADGSSGSNCFGIVLSHTIIERLKIYRAGNRAIAFEGYDDGYVGGANGFGNVTIKDVEIWNSWKNAISVNKHDSARISYVRLENILIDGYSMIVPDSGGQGTGFASQGINILARQTTGDNPGHKFFLNNITIRNGYSNALEFNGLYGSEGENDIFIKNLTIENCNVDSATTPAAVLITNARGGFVDGLKITNTVGGPAWRDRTGYGRWNITNALIDSTQAGTSPGYAFDLFGTSNYMISNSRILDNDRGIYANNSGTKWGWITNSHIRGDTLGYYTYLYDIRDVFYLGGTLVEEKLEGGYTTTGQDIVYNGRFKADSANVVLSQNGDGLPDGWQLYIPYGGAVRDSVIAYIEPDSGLVIRNISSQTLTVVLRQDVTARLSGSDTYTVNVEVNTVSGGGTNTLRTWVNAGPVGSNLAAGNNQQTSQSITSWVGVGRSGGMGANTFIIIDYIEALVE